MIWTFHQTGSIPGVPGDFSGVRVEVDDAANEVVSITPLTAHSEFEPATGTAVVWNADVPANTTFTIDKAFSGEPGTEQSEPERVAEAE